MSSRLLPTIRQAESHELKPLLYKGNFNLLTKESHFKYDFNSIYLKIPCPNKNFVFKGLYSLDLADLGIEIFGFNKTRILLCHITDNTDFNRIQEPTTHFLEGEVNYIDVIDLYTCKSGNFSVKNHQGLICVVFNSNTNTVCEKSLSFLKNKELFISEFKEIEEKLLSLINNYFSFMRPDEAGGGVIVGNP
jgi:hypothetical protein